ncbi:MAG TPA: zinc ribbon domain-containing protein [Longimicrobium sp.]
MDSIDRLYRRIADVLLREPGTAVTVGDIYQHLVPYRTVRSELGFGELAEYEHALLRLLSGERDYLVVERADVQEEFQRELRTTNPILGIYRDYADVGVYLNPYAPEVPAADLTAPPPASTGQTSTLAAALARNGDADAPGVVLDFTSPEPATPSTPAKASRPRPKSCPGCRSTLPPGREIRFCPFCGKCLAPIPCPECSTVVEPEWKFCIMCGWPRDAAPVPPPPERPLR